MPPVSAWHFGELFAAKVLRRCCAIVRMGRMRFLRARLPWITLSLLVLCSSSRSDQPSAQALEFFEKKVRPVLAEHCYKCHSQQTKRPKGSLRLDSREALL